MTTIDDPFELSFGVDESAFATRTPLEVARDLADRFAGSDVVFSACLKTRRAELVAELGPTFDTATMAVTRTTVARVEDALPWIDTSAVPSITLFQQTTENFWNIERRVMGGTHPEWSGQPCAMLCLSGKSAESAALVHWLSTCCAAGILPADTNVESAMQQLLYSGNTKALRFGDVLAQRTYDSIGYSTQTSKVTLIAPPEQFDAFALLPGMWRSGERIELVREGPWPLVFAPPRADSIELRVNSDGPVVDELVQRVGGDELSIAWKPTARSWLIDAGDLTGIHLDFPELYEENATNRVPLVELRVVTYLSRNIRFSADEAPRDRKLEEIEEARRLLAARAMVGLALAESRFVGGEW